MARKEKKYHFIYKTTNLLTNRYYIGMHSTDNLDDGYLGSGKRLRYSINKYGAENHVREILEFVDSREELKKKEMEIVSLDEIAKEECMNLITGGVGGIFNEEHQNKMKAGASKWMLKKWEDNDFREKMLSNFGARMKQYHQEGKIKYDTFSGKEHSEKTKKLISEKAKLRTGSKNSQYGTCWITKDGINKKIKVCDINVFIQQGWMKGRK